MQAGPLLAVAVASALTGAPVHDSVPWVRGGPIGRVGLHDGWVVASDPGDRGLALDWESGRFAGRHVEVPYVPNAGSVTGPAGSRSFRGSVAWYRRELVVPRSGRYALRFASVNHLATVWVDGRLVARHVGGYLPFEVPLTLSAGRPHRLVVRADWRDPAAMSAAGWHRTWFNFGGIDREVTLRPLGPSDLDAPAVVTTLGGGGARVAVSVRLTNLAPRARAIPVTGSLSRPGQRIRFSLGDPWVPAGATSTVRTTVIVERPALWAPGSPRLYDLRLEAGAGESGWLQRVGLRQLTWAGGRLRLNGRPLTLRGAAIQEDAQGRGDALRPADQAALVRSLRRLGANATRSQHPLDEGLLERLDAAGILVWQGIGPVDAPGAWVADTPALERAAVARALASATELQPHPSIVAWSLANEIAGNGHGASQVAYLRDTAAALHRSDPGRLVAADVWGEHVPAVAGAAYRPLDAIGITNYEGWYENLALPGGALEQLLARRLAAWRRTFAGKVLAVTEFGAEANAANPPNAPGGYAFQAALLARHLAVYRRTPWLAGELVWDLRDFAVAPSFAGGSIRSQAPGISLVHGLNQKGLEDYAGRPKPAFAVVARALRAMGAAARAAGGL